MKRERGRVALLSAVLMASSAVLPAGGVSFAIGAAAVGLLVLATVVSVLSDAARAAVGLAAGGWLAAVVIVGSPTDALVICAAVLLRVWAGVPELVRLGRPGLPELSADVVGGAAAAVLVLLVGRDPAALPPEDLLLAIASTSALVVLGALRLRR